MKTQLVALFCVLACFATKPSAAQSADEGQTRSSSAEPLVPPPSKAKALQLFNSVTCQGPEDGEAECDVVFPRLFNRQFALIDNISCLLKGERADVRWTQVHAVEGYSSRERIVSAQNLKMRNTGAAGAGEIRFYSSNDSTTFYLDGGQFPRIRMRISFYQSPPAMLDCSLNGRYL